MFAAFWMSRMDIDHMSARKGLLVLGDLDGDVLAGECSRDENDSPFITSHHFTTVCRACTGYADA